MDPMVKAIEFEAAAGERGLGADEDVCILHIDDEPTLADLVATFLQRERDAFEVITETNPREGLDRLAGIEADCIVCDYDMPGLDGLAVLETIRERDPDLPFVLFTGKGSEEIASEAISRGVTEYLQKGGGTDQYEVLANRIEQAVARYRAERRATRSFEAIETAHDGIGFLDGGEFVFVNRAYADITGYDRAELLGEPWETLYPDGDEADSGNVGDDGYNEAPSETRSGGWAGPSVLVRRDGEPVTIDHRLARTEGGTLISTVSDAAAVREELSLRERAMDAAPVGIVVTDPGLDDNPIVHANDEFVDLTGYAREEVLGRNCRFLQGPATREEAVGKMRRAIEDAEPVTVELRNYRKNGEVFWNRVRIAPLRNDDGDVTNYVGFQEDVTEYRERTDPGS